MKLSKKQLEASTSLDGVNMVIAVPGAGKTTILLERINNLIKSGVNPERILTITFSKAAATELLYRFKRDYIDLEKSPKFYTIHAFSYMILRDYAKKNGKEYRLLEGSKDINKYNLLSKFYYEENKEYISEDGLDNLINKIGYLKNMMIDDEDFSKEIENFDKIYKKYEDFKSRNSFIDFDDMLVFAYDILKNEKSILNYYINKYDYIQLDEGQDTSLIQMEIIKMLTSRKRNLFLVADDDQSIYSFRGANPHGLFELEDYFKDIKIHYMDTNYRCTKDIVDTASKLISKNQMRYKKDLNSEKSYHSPISIKRTREIYDQYEYILEKIKNENLKDIGILYRNNVSAMGLIDYFEKNNIKFNITDNSKIRFFNNKITRDMLDILKFAYDYNDIESFCRIYNKLDSYIDRGMINKIENSRSSNDVFTKLLNLNSIPDYKIKKIEELEAKFNTLGVFRHKNKLRYIFEDMGYFKYLKYINRKNQTGLYSSLQIFSVIEKIYRNSSNLDDFIGRLKYLDSLVYKKQDDDIDIYFLTAHSSKGREFSNVFIIDAYQGNFPKSENKDDTKIEREEERRLFYVAMTRAKENLEILYPSRFFEEKLERSQFIDEIIK